MTKRLSLVALTVLVAGASVLGLTRAPASADGLSVFVGIPAPYVHYDDWRYRHDRDYHDGWDRWHRERDREYRGDYHHDDRYYRHDDHRDHERRGHD